MSLLNSITLEAIDEIKKKENMDRIKQHIMDPLTDYMFQKLCPYILISSILFIIIFFIIVVIFFFALRKTIQ